MGARLALAGEKGPWRLVEVCGVFDNGPDSGSYEAVLRPVSIEDGFDCSSRKVSPDAVLALGYVVAS